MVHGWSSHLVTIVRRRRRKVNTIVNQVIQDAADRTGQRRSEQMLVGSLVGLGLVVQKTWEIAAGFDLRRVPSIADAIGTGARAVMSGHADCGVPPA
jgi:hypothetical protein